jgi:hypothetical protein
MSTSSAGLLGAPGALGKAWDVLSEVQTLACRKSIHDPAYLSIGVTSGIGARLCRVPGRGVFRGIGVRLCRILDMNFGEFQFHALR